ncbi:cyclin-dependent kinase 5 activator 1 isoform X1 [Paramuricea clavata]|uniref:Cyclin-dependent kinase 5 activator 1 isoform X1 n=1 Tax=Paramuricea clavata TaxID=317549 RepID=A0A6S7HY18_PARCT|nr:cyclin-dependent kinase 5 activator 1 isoform X1 [Paramuricea clavata]
MGSNHSLNRKEILQEYGVVNHANNKEKNNNTSSVPTLIDSMGKENVILSNHDVQLATAYLHKYAHVSKRRMKTIFMPTATKNTNSTNENKTLKPAQANSAIIPATTLNNTHKTKTQNISNAKAALTSSHFTMKCLGTFVCARYLRMLPHLSINDVITWLKSVDRALTLSGWQDHAFLTTPNITFIYMLARDSLPENVQSMNQLKSELLTILYMAYTYSGPEISYPLKPFLCDKNRAEFWTRCVWITNNLSGDMLKIHKDSQFYEEVQIELATYGCLFQRSKRT